MNPLDAYARSVVDGQVPAGKYHILSACRHLNDIARQGTPDFPFRFELAKAERFWKFAELLKHYRGKWSGQNIRLEPWQKFITGSLLGWIHTETGLRRFRTSFVQVGRKNGKTLTAAVVLLYLTFFDGEQGAAGYSVATKREQARIVFGDCRRLVQSSGLKDRIKVQVGRLSRDETASTLEALGADYSSTDGLSPSAVCVDEMHAMKDRGLLDVMETATSARQQPVIYEITTFGSDPVSPWGDQNDYSQKILEGVLVDESFFVFTAHADDSDDWTLPETARKANPNYGISVSPEDLAGKVLKAKGIPAAAASYRIKHLNVCISADAPWLSLDGWRKGQSVWSADDLAGQSCYVGVDLASKIDLCALVFVFPPAPGRAKWMVLPYVWTPAETVPERAHRDRAPYPTWIEQGYLLTTPGTTIDHGVIRDVLKAERERFDLEFIGFDPWHAHATITALKAEDGFTDQQVLEVRQGPLSLSAATVELGAQIADGNMDAGGSPLMAWCASNVVVEYDRNQNPVLSKKRSRNRIDPFSAIVNAMSLALRMDKPEASVYLTRGIRTLGG
jgi:phage terminase large subunit-like protein